MSFSVVLKGSLGICPHATKNIHCGYCHFRLLGTHVLANWPARFGFKFNKRDILSLCLFVFPFPKKPYLYNGKNLLKWTWLFPNNHWLPWQVRVPKHVSQYEINGKSVSLSICHQYLLALSRKNVCTSSRDHVLMWSERSDFNMSWVHHGCSHTCICGHVICFCQV